jgi:predicted TIM-barrel fold metal-dependent hydrolase
MLTIDTHLHVFPFLGGACGYSSADERMRIMQYVMRHAMPRRKRDGAIVTEPTLWDGEHDGFDGLLDVNFRAGRFGRYEWDKDGESYYTEGFPPSLQDMESTADYMVAQMDFAGIDVAVLQNDYLYGYLNDYFGEAVRRYPSRFVGTVKLREVEAFTDAQLSELNRCAADFGFKGVFFQKAGFNLAGSRDRLDDRKFDQLWSEIERLGLMLYLHGFFDEWTKIASVASRFPGIEIVHTLPTWNFPRDGIGRMPREGKVHLRQDIRELLSLPNFSFEIGPIAYGALYEYPYTELIPTFRPYYEEYGGAKFVWGSDMPNLERWCTYQQGIDYLRLHWNFISKADKLLITGGNAARIFRVEEAASVRQAPVAATA